MALDVENIFPTADTGADEFFISEAEKALTPRIVVKTANEIVVSSTAYQDDDELLMSLSANSMYKFILIFGVNNESADPDIKYTVKGPTGSSGRQYVTVFDSSAVTGIDQNNNFALGLETTTAGHKLWSDGVVNETWFRIEGWVKTGTTAGNLQFSWGPKINDSDDCVVLAGSSLEVTRQ